MNDDPSVQNSPSGLTPPTDFANFMRNYQDMVFSTAARLTGNETQAEDISQEVFLEAHQHFAMLSTRPTAGGWLKTVATNLALNHGPLPRYDRGDGGAAARCAGDFEASAQALDSFPHALKAEVAFFGAVGFFQHETDSVVADRESHVFP